MDANRKRISERVIGCAFEVSNTLGAGFLENVYENALAVEFTRAGISFDRQHGLSVSYKGEFIGQYVADFLVEKCLIVEIKALSRLVAEHEAQVMNYLKATGLSVGLLLNFGTPRLGVRRIVWGHDDNQAV
ncbi:MAG: GxxExxY protein [Pseudomonadota bacterium]